MPPCWQSNNIAVKFFGITLWDNHYIVLSAKDNQTYRILTFTWLFQHSKSQSSFQLPKWPQIFLEVISLDSWSRCRTEGYGFSPLPLSAGCYDHINVCTWRPILDGPVTEMRYLIEGGHIGN